MAHSIPVVEMLDEIPPLQLITAKLGGSIVSLDFEAISIGFFHFPVWDLILPLA